MMFRWAWHGPSVELERAASEEVAETDELNQEGRRGILSEGFQGRCNENEATIE